MSRLYGRIFLAAIFLMLAATSCQVASGNKTMKLKDLALGKVVQVGGLKFVKVGDNKYLATNTCPPGKMFAPLIHNCVTIQEYGCSNPIGTMQTWKNCTSAATPTGTNYSLDVCLMDERDGKTYQVRKFADGHCWMVTNLAYGAGCQKTTFDKSNVNQVNVVGPGLYGECRWDETKSLSSTYKYGHTYNWQALMQDPQAYYGNNYQPPEPVQGICPHGWHVPRGNTSSEYKALYEAIGKQISFFSPGGNFLIALAGQIRDTNGRLSSQGANVQLFTSTQGSGNKTNAAYYWWFPERNYEYLDDGKYFGGALRCIQDY